MKHHQRILRTFFPILSPLQHHFLVVKPWLISMLAPCLEYTYVYYSLLLLVFKLVFFTHQKKQLYLVGRFNPSENISQLGSVGIIYGKMKNVPNHQPVAAFLGYVFWMISLQFLAATSQFQMVKTCETAIFMAPRLLLMKFPVIAPLFPHKKQLPSGYLT